MMKFINGTIGYKLTLSLEDRVYCIKWFTDMVFMVHLDFKSHMDTSIELLGGRGNVKNIST